MATLIQRPRMAFWDLEVGGKSINGFLNKFISSMAFEYSLDGSPVGQIAVTSDSYIKHILREEVPVKIKMGWDRLNLATMIDGKIVTSPDGTSAEKLNYTLTIGDKVLDMAKKQKNRVFKIPQKAAVINQLIAEAGYTPVVVIADTTPLKAKEIPIQRSETALNFLYRTAMKWNCLTWVNGSTIYFIDADKAHNYGNIDRTRSLTDLLLDYELNYRVNLSRNNVHSISWKIGKKKGGVAGSPGTKGADENGEVKMIEDYDIEVEGKFYKLKPKIKSNPGLTLKYIQLIINAEISKTRGLLREYFVPVVHKSSTNKDKSHTPAHKAGKITLDVMLNHGDPYLRAPRTGVLNSGSQSSNSDLPAFLFRDAKPQKYYINKVRTELNNGMINTKLQMTLGKQ